MPRIQLPCRRITVIFDFPFHLSQLQIHIMIRIPFDVDRISHGHLVHPLELASLIHFYDFREEIHGDQRKAVDSLSSHMRRMAPNVAELINNNQPNHPFQHIVPQISGLLGELQEELDARLQDTDWTFQPVPAPRIPYDACGRLRGPHCCYPAHLISAGRSFREVGAIPSVNYPDFGR